MISPAELRIGNLVYSKVHKRDFYISGIGKNSIEQSDEDYDTHISYSKLDGILLTEDWLLKLGFKNEFDKDTRYWNFKGFKVWDDGLRMYYHINSETLTNVASVHQLQNLYYAVSTEELTINQPQYQPS